MTSIADFFRTQLTGTSRWLIFVAALALVPAIALPTWTITLHAPQYPDGLQIVIYPHTVGGDLTEVNLLNHYIGMQAIHPDEFAEFRFIPFFILRFLGFAVLTALVGQMAIAAIGWMDFVLFGVVMLYTFQRWLHAFGTELSPDAPLRIDPFTPGFLGTTKVGQFGVESWPASGAILMGVAGLLGPVVVLWEWRRARRRSTGS